MSDYLGKCWGTGKFMQASLLLCLCSTFFCCHVHHCSVLAVPYQLETILLTVWSGSLLTWSVNHRWEYNKQGESKSKLPTARCRFGKLYPGKWSFLSRLSCLLFYFLSDHASNPIFYPQSPNSPVTLNHSGSHTERAEDKTRLSQRVISVWECYSCGVLESGVQPSFHIVLIVSLDFSHIGSASTPTHSL